MRTRKADRCRLRHIGRIHQASFWSPIAHGHCTNGYRPRRGSAAGEARLISLSIESAICAVPNATTKHEDPKAFMLIDDLSLILAIET